MRSWKRELLDKATGALGVNIVRKGTARELVELEYLAAFLREFHVDCVFDVGANKGRYAECVRRLEFRGKIISFEPVPFLAAELRDKARFDPAWVIEEVALDEEVRDVTFNVMAHSSLSSMYDPKSYMKEFSVVQKLSLRTGTLKTYFDKYSEGFRRPFLKLDTQGAEIAISKGAGDRLSRFVGLQSELSFEPNYRDQIQYRDAIEFFESQGFALTALVPNGFHFPELIELDCFMYNTRVSHAAS